MVLESGGCPMAEAEPDTLRVQVLSTLLILYLINHIIRIIPKEAVHAES